MRAAPVVALVLLACNTPRKAATRDVTGSWTIASATNPGGAGSYHGRVAVSRRGDALLLDWTIAGTPPYHGVGLESGDRLGVGWSTDRDAEVVVYAVDGGSLVGRSASVAAPTRAGSEKLAGSPGPAGSYRVVSAHAPGTGASYTGDVVITPTGPTFRVHWQLSTGSYEGVGVLDGRTFVVGRAPHGAGVMLYRRDGAALEGRWAQPTSAALGAERLER